MKSGLASAHLPRACLGVQQWARRRSDQVSGRQRLKAGGYPQPASKWRSHGAVGVRVERPVRLVQVLDLFSCTDSELACQVNAIVRIFCEKS